MLNIQSHIEQVTKSKSQLKREMHQLQELGVSLTKLSSKQLASLPLSDDLRIAIEDAPKHSAHGAKRRHLQFIGKLMVKQDIGAIKEKLAEFEQVNNNFNAEFHQLEKMRNDLLVNGNTAINNLLATYPNTDRGHLRKLIRTTLKEQELNEPPSASRKLFKYLRELTNQNH